MNLKEVVLNYLTDNDEGMKHLRTWFLNVVMQEEADQQTGAGRYRRSSSRRTYRTGHRKRTLKTRHEELILNKPQLRDIPFQTKIFERYSRIEKALENAILETYLQGVSTGTFRKLSLISVSRRSPLHTSRRLPLIWTRTSICSSPSRLRRISAISS